MPVIQEIRTDVNCNISAGEKESKSRNKWDNKEKIFQAVGRIRGGRLKSFYWKMFGTANNSSVRARKNTLNVASKSISNKNPIFRIGETDKFYGFTVGQIKEMWTEEPQQPKKPEKPKGFCRAVFDNVDNYFDKSTLHGLRYVGDSTITIGERIFWLMAFLTAVCFAAYFINNIYAKYNLNPVIISFSPTAVSIAEIPFPAITICSVNIVKKTEGERILQYGTETEKLLMDDYCDSNYTIAKGDDDLENLADWDTLKAFILKVTQSCSEMLKLCKWRQREHDCNVIFNPILTDDGYCCTFNRLPSSSIFRNPKELNDLNETYPSEVYDWTPQKGYINASTDALPWRSPGAGAHLGLSVVVDAQLDSYYCQTTNSAGFKVLLSNPIETPKMADFGFFMRPGLEARIVIKPKKVESTETLKNIDVVKRQCFFPEERYLQFYRSYSEKNCKLECQANRTLRACNCVPYFLPKNRTTRICGKKQDNCVKRMKAIMEKPTLTQECDCLPACFEISYSKSHSSNVLSLKAKPKEDIIKNETLEYFVSNMAIFHFYYTDSTFTQRVKSEIYGFSEFLSNTGGLLGLFLGFSFLSAVEIGYYILIRLSCKFFQRKHLKNKNKNKIIVSDGNFTPQIKRTLYLNRCNCLPGCYELSYEKSFSQLVFDKNVRPTEDALKNLSANYCAENIAILNFYYTQQDYEGMLKSEMCGFSEFLCKSRKEFDVSQALTACVIESCH
ncbi:amiloride-sensitive sodium channel-related [Holotrichia oblita]|uniref:Amiloride-sensitive sodium channel-related n=1 Tax=Holotrichia oblita TaxID=644536 RepID=A0ACB9TBX6_HOLOL|nr:amiloride-sensitive sodium channel-related [Holotrichia oblita]